MWKEKILKIEKIKSREKSESALIELSKTQLIILNKEKSFKSTLMSKLIKSLKENPKVNQVAYIQSEEVIDRAITHC